MKIVRSVLLGVLALLLVASVFGVWFVRNPWPQLSGTVALPGMSASVQVIRDKWGVPNIYAQNDRDLLMAQGYVHAQDRLWSMYYSVLTASGTLSSVVGEPALDYDRVLRTLGLRRAAEAEWATMEPEAKELLQAYADGVNGFLAANRGRLPIEFTVLGFDPPEWTPVDSLAYGYMTSLNLAGNYRLEFLRARLIAEIGAEKTRDLLPPYDPSKPLIIPDEAQGYSWMRDVGFAGFDAVDSYLGEYGPLWGSNNWVVAGSRTTTGRPILAGDTHMNLYLPSIWYMNGLHGGRFNVTGFTLPGVPAVLFGHNEQIAWAVTNLNPDVQDLYIEKLDNRASPTRYEFDGEWHDLEIIRDTIEVKGAEPVPLNIYLTRHGPIINDVVADMAEAEPMAFQWAVVGDSQLFPSILRLNTASNWGEFREALRSWRMPGQNFVYADVAGNIGYQMTSQIPIRAPQHDGLVPVPGWTGEYEWLGFIPYDELPSAYNPPEGFIATANNKVVGDDYPYRITEEWDPGYRAQRIVELLAANDRMDMAASAAIQGDTYSLPAAAIQPFMVKIAPTDEAEAAAIAELQGWDLHFEADQVAASLFQAWYWFIFQNTIADDMSEDMSNDYLAGQYERHGRFHIAAMERIIQDNNNPWFDDKRTPAVETRDEIMQKSLGDALAWLRENYGDSMSGWRWGEMHRLRHVNLLARSGNPLFIALYYVPPIPMRGENFTINTGTFTFDEPFSVIHGVSQRQIIDMGDFDTMQAIHSTGQSGLVRHPNRTDMIEMWEQVQFLPMYFSRERVEASAANILTLTPEGAP